MRKQYQGRITSPLLISPLILICSPLLLTSPPPAPPSAPAPNRLNPSQTKSSLATFIPVNGPFTFTLRLPACWVQSIGVRSFKSPLWSVSPSISLWLPQSQVALFVLFCVSTSAFPPSSVAMFCPLVFYSTFLALLLFSSHRYSFSLLTFLLYLSSTLVFFMSSALYIFVYVSFLVLFSSFIFLHFLFPLLALFSFL